MRCGSDGVRWQHRFRSAVAHPQHVYLRAIHVKNVKDSDALAMTTSLCPDCLEEVPGRYEERDGGVFLTRECAHHGSSSRHVWGSLDHWEWAADFGPSPEYDGGDLAVDPDHACLAVVEVTEDCNLSCSYCFASSGPGGTHRPMGEIEALLDTVADAGGRPI